MRTLRVSLMGTVILVLVCAPVALAQAEEAPDPMAPAIVTIDPVAEPNDVIEQGTFTGAVGGDWRLEDLRQEWVWEATDPRLSGVVTTVDNWYSWVVPSGQEMTVEPGTYELVNDGGRWTGTGTGLSIDVADLPHGQLVSGMILLSGEDGYEGLSALIHTDWSAPEEPPVIYGVIFPGEMPYPEPPEPSAE